MTSKKGSRHSGRGEGGRGAGANKPRGVRQSRTKRSRQSRQLHDIDGVEINAIELAPPSDKRVRGKLPASVEIYDGDDHIEEIQGHRRNRKKSGRTRDRNESIDEIDAEDGANSAEEDEELLDDDEFDYESFTNSDPHEIPWHVSVKRIMLKLFWIVVAVAAIGYIFYDDEMLEEQEIEEDVTPKEPYSYNGYKDARIPDDDIAQYGGGLIGAEIFGISNNETEDDESEQLENEPHSYHEPTGILQNDKLWEELNGYAEMVEPYDADHELPVFWHVPKCGGTTIQDLVMHCIGLVGANEIGGAHVKDSGPLEVIKLDNGNSYVNVDMAHPEGIAHARDMGFGQSGLANVVLTAYFDQAASVFDDDHKGRCFTMLRHPIRRAISMFYYLKDATWENTYSEAYKDMTIEEYAVSEYAEDNWMVRFLTNSMSGGVYEGTLDLAKEVLESKCLIGIMEEFGPSFKRFNEFFGWNKIDFDGPVKMLDRGSCVGRVIGNPDNAHSHPIHEEGGEVWNLLMQKNKYDVKLYEHGLHLFHDVQSELIKR